MWRLRAGSTFAAMNDRRTALLMGLVAASVAVMSILHLAGAFERRTDAGAGLPEAIIGVILVVGALAVVRNGDRRAALGALGFAIACFLVGLRFTIDDGGVQLAYHAAVLPVLALGLVLASRPGRTGDGGRAGFRRDR
jgi:peptidoglycan/LPS O-acetylase OafA/YrhL